MYTPNAVLDALIAAGLGDTEREQITPQQYEAAMRGEVVIERGKRGSPSPMCPRCRVNHRASGRRYRATYCRECERAINREYRKIV